MQVIRKSFEKFELPEEALDIIMASWRRSTSNQYNVYIRRWVQFCSRKQTNPLQTTVTVVVSYLTDLFVTLNIGYSAICTAASALSSFIVLNDGFTVGSHPVVRRFLKGVFNMKPPAPRYDVVWDVKLVLDFLRKLAPAESIRLKDLTFKTTMLMALVSAQRLQTLHLICIDNIEIHPGQINIRIPELVKQSRPGNIGHEIKLFEYPLDERLCVCKYLLQYMKRTEVLRKNHKKLFLSYRKPHEPISRDTIARWIKQTLSEAGIDTQKFKAHSTRTTAVSTASSKDHPVQDILKTAGWANEKTFEKFYKKPIQTKTEFANFGHAVLT